MRKDKHTFKLDTALLVMVLCCADPGKVGRIGTCCALDACQTAGARNDW